jgi:hypothetical protein
MIREEGSPLRKGFGRDWDETAEFCDGEGFREGASDNRKEAFLSRMETLVPWGAFCALIEPH